MVERQLTFAAEAASVDAIQRAGYRLSDRLSIDLAGDGNGGLQCILRTETTDPIEADEIAGEFRKRVLDEVLRERIRAETADVRNVILSLAFSQTSLISQD